jgi:hypothetical protein
VLAPALAAAPIVDGAHGDPVLFVEPTRLSIAHKERVTPICPDIKVLS